MQCSLLLSTTCCFRSLERQRAVSLLILSTFIFIRHILSFMKYSFALAATGMQFAIFWCDEMMMRDCEINTNDA